MEKSQVSHSFWQAGQRCRAICVRLGSSAGAGSVGGSSFEVRGEFSEGHILLLHFPPNLPLAQGAQWSLCLTSRILTLPIKLPNSHHAIYPRVLKLPVGKEAWPASSFSRLALTATRSHSLPFSHDPPWSGMGLRGMSGQAYLVGISESQYEMQGGSEATSH